MLAEFDFELGAFVLADFDFEGGFRRVTILRLAVDFVVFLRAIVEPAKALGVVAAATAVLRYPGSSPGVTKRKYLVLPRTAKAFICSVRAAICLHCKHQLDLTDHQFAASTGFC